MLEALDRLQERYPHETGWIRLLASEQPEERAQGFKRLWETVLHQATVDDRTHLFVPFWIELLGVPDYPDRCELLVMLETAACQHANVVFYRGRQKSHEAREIEAKAHRAVVAGLPLYKQLLDDADPLIRIHAALALAVCVTDFPRAGEALANAIRRERDAEVKAILLDCFGSLWHLAASHPEATVSPTASEARDQLLAAILRDPDQAAVVRVMAVFSLLRLSPATWREEALAVFRLVMVGAYEAHQQLRRDRRGEQREGSLVEELTECLHREEALLLPLWVELCRHPDARLRGDAVSQLLCHGRKHPGRLPEIVPLLAERLFDADTTVSQCAEGIAQFDDAPLAPLVVDQPEAVRRRIEALCWHRRGRTRCKERQPEQALAALDEAIRLEPDRVDFHESRLLVLASRPQDRGALLMELETILALDPENAGALERRAKLREEEGNLTGVIDDLSRILTCADSPTRLIPRAATHVWRGRTYRALGEEDRAETDFTRAIELLEANCRRFQDHDLSLAYSLRGQVRTARGEHDLALDDFAASRKHFRLCLGDVEYAITYRKWEEAEAKLQRWLRDFPCEPTVYLMRAHLLAMQKDYPAALADIETALILDPTRRNAYDQRARLHEDLQQWELARADYDRLVELGHMDPNDLRRRRALEQIGGHRRVIEDCLARLQHNPNDLGALNTLAFLRAASADDGLRNGREALALAQHLLERARERRSAAASLLFTLAAAYAECGQFEEAAHWQEEAEKREPPKFTPSWVERYRAGQRRRVKVMSW
jgi:serine/threonine-protein kinase